MIRPRIIQTITGLIAAETAARKHKDRPQAGTGVFRFIAGQRVWCPAGFIAEGT